MRRRLFRYSTGRDARLSHATGLEIEKARGERRPGLRYSTGEEAMVRHATGTDLKREKLYPCPLCQGSGEEPSGVKCLECQGRGIIP